MNDATRRFDEDDDNPPVEGLLHDVISWIITGDPDSIQIEAFRNSAGRPKVIEIAVDQDDRRFVIGRQGQMLVALNTIVRAMLRDSSVTVELIQPPPPKRQRSNGNA